MVWDDGAETDSILYLDSAAVGALLGEIDPIAVVESVFALHASRDVILPDEAYLGWTTQSGAGARSLSMPAFVGGAFQACGTKIINANPANAARDLPRASGITVLFDVETARISCIMEGAAISALRTAAVSMLCLRRLARRSIERLAIVGAGRIAGAHLELATKTLPELREVRIFDLDPNAASRLAGAAGATRAVACESVADALGGADAIVTATTATAGYIGCDLLEPGTTVVNVSLDDLCEDVYLCAGLVVVDDWMLVKHDDRRLLGRLHRAGRVGGPGEPGRWERSVDAEIGDIVAGRHPGRTSPDQVVIVNPFGLAIEDVAFAGAVYAAALRQRIGAHLRR